MVSFQRTRYTDGDFDDLRGRQGTGGQAVIQGLPIEQFHCQVWAALPVAAIVDRADVGMTEGRGDVLRSKPARSRAMHPPVEIEQVLDARIAELGPAAPSTPGPGMAGAATAGAGGPGVSATGPGGQAAAGPQAPGAQVTVNISIAPSLKSRLTSEAPLFVFAREPGTPGPPLAAKRLTSRAIGTQIQLSAADSMMPGRMLVAGHQVSITARVSFSGQPLPAAGDLYGEVTYDVGHDGARNLVIDRIAE